MEESKYEIHKGNCCAEHGCHYGYKDCPVFLKTIKQRTTCFLCFLDGIKNLEQLEKVLKIEEEIKELAINSDQLNDNESIEIPVYILKKLLKKGSLH